MGSLSNKLAIITEVSSGTGNATAKLFANEGAKVIVSTRCLAGLDLLVKEIVKSGGLAIALAGDVSEESFSKALVDLATDKFGGVDIAFNNAGIIGDITSTPGMTLSSWSTTINTNLTSAFLGAKHQIPAMIK